MNCAMGASYLAPSRITTRPPRSDPVDTVRAPGQDSRRP